MKTMTKNSTCPVFFLKCLLFSYVLTVGLLLLLALFLYRFQLQEKTVAIGIIVIYVVSSFFAGFLSGKRMGSRKFLWGLFAGVLYFAVLILVSLIVDHGVSGFSSNLITTFFVCAGSGMLGGMLS